MNNSKIFYFNPTCELAVANGSFSYMPPLLLQEMESDLAILPFIFGTEKDFVLTENPPSAIFQDYLKNLGFELPSFKNLTELEALPAGSFDSIVPWGWSPAAHYKLRNLKDKCSKEFKNSPTANWNDDHKSLYERSTSLDLLHKILRNDPPDWFIDQKFCGVKAGSFDEIEFMLKDHASIVLKAPVSSSGRGIQIIRKQDLNASNKQWISGVFKQQNYLIVEPFIEKLVDISFQFEVTNNSEVLYHGFTVFITNSNGQYKGTLIHPDLKTIIPEEDIVELQDKIDSTAGILKEALKESDFTRLYRGYLGIDALFFKDQNKLMMQPCIELNCRTNMGILSIFLEKKIDQKISGIFEIGSNKPGNLQNLMNGISTITQYPYSDATIYSGCLPLTEFNPKTKFGAYLSLGSAK
jgi:hypothetical protein